ncbi:putative cobaltochelatase [Streptomyces albus]|uniref:Mg-protoporphyrin IX chelatase n=1 Tax=Streptomyces albus TaxID=1888 RepID=A0A8H1LMF0_9ACTN|nr:MULTISPECIES: putative cobaltochelatase [Streptomyces]EPD96222.1 cobaltochelatase subunit [Streptomyces sp. HPH0547]TGG89825.1 putative cobaltochelatase [Streptomyces albus]UVN57550.1 putative cobaltochelatase [Streptomyces albus]GHJ20034.1 magnesium chelatase [Streptomyces albus]
MIPYPFPALVGQEDLQLSLLLNAVSPAIGGVLVRGEKGTAKSTAVRALTALLPPVEVVAGCRFSCDPASPDPGCPDGPHAVGAGTGETRPARMVELPVGASEDRLVGALDIERALSEGVKAFEPGLLADAHRGILYVDEVNLLHDHLVDLLLDAAAMGSSYVEREGVSVRHAARFLLVGTMNPEEGELRPQLLDRFGLTVEVAASREPEQRVEVVRRRLAHDDDPEAFAARWADEEQRLRERIAAARALLPRVRLGDAALRQIAATCAAFEVDGMRADLVMARTATALAAWAGRDQVEQADVRQAALLALPHRRRRNPFDAPGLDEEMLDRTLEEHAPQEDEGPEPPDGGPGDGPDGGPGDGPDGGPGGGGGVPPQDAPSQSGQAPRDEGGPADRPSLPEQAGPAAQEPSGTGTGAQAPAAPQPAAPAGEPFKARALTVPGLGEGAAGRRSRARTAHGRTTGARRPQGALGKLHLAATVQAAAPHQQARGRRGSGLVVRRDDLREAVREGREGNLVLFVVDASGSMAARQRMSAVKGAVLSLLLDAYQRRDKVGMVTFRRGDAEVTLPPTSSVDAAAARLETLPTGGRTPLAAGLLRAREVLRVERLRDPARRALLVTVTDGRATGGPEPLVRARQAAGLLAADGVASVVVDCEQGHVRLGLARELAQYLGGEAVTLDELRADAVTALVRRTTGAQDARIAGRAA